MAAQECEEDRLRYRAFLSYSHEDSAAAAKLHRRLETYRLPRGLAVADAGGPERRIGRIFRDREELPASPNLTDTVRRALARSDALVVLCSPGARRSPWVAKEIALFAELHPQAPILAALIRGLPDDAFPEVLVAEGEPLAADLRPEGDGPRLGTLKLVAGLTGVPLDVLVQRDAQRRLRSVTAVTAFAILVAVAMGIMATAAIQARDEAERQRAAAEGLIEYMLTDLRDGLRGVGRLDLMTDVNQRAMEYYQDQGDLRRLPPASLERRARVIGEIGEDDENRGNFDMAQSRYEELHRTTAALLAKAPEDPERIFSHARSENRLALLAYARGQTERALAGWEQTDRHLQTASAWGADRPEWLRLSAYVNGNICAALLRLGRPASQSLERCRRAVHFNDRLVESQPEDESAKYDLAFHNLWLAEALIANGDGAEAAGAQQRYLALVEHLIAKQPDNMLWREQQMQIYVRHAQLLERRGQPGEARKYIARARGIGDMLSRRDPENAVWKSYRARLSAQ